MFEIRFGVVALMAATPATAQLVSVQLDYPPAQLRAGIQGSVGFAVDLAKDGRVTACRVTQTSGNADLDRQTCSQLQKTGRFRPALDTSGRPTKSTYTSTLRWRIPRPAPDTQAATSPHPQ